MRRALRKPPRQRPILSLGARNLLRRRFSPAHATVGEKYKGLSSGLFFQINKPLPKQPVGAADGGFGRTKGGHYRRFGHAGGNVPCHRKAGCLGDWGWLDGRGHGALWRRGRRRLRLRGLGFDSRYFLFFKWTRPVLRTAGRSSGDHGNGCGYVRWESLGKK